MAQKKKRLGDMLIESGVIDDEQLGNALKRQRERHIKLGEALMDLGYVTEETVCEVLQAQLGYDIVRLSDMNIPEDARNAVSDVSLLKKYVVMPVELVGGNTLRLAMADPMDLMAADDISIITGMQVIPVISTQTDVLATIDKYYGNIEARNAAAAYARERGNLLMEEEEVEDDVSNAPVITLVKTLVEQAARQRASDIHIEPFENRVRVRNRVDGALLDVGSYQINMLPAIAARIKIISGLDISEKRKPQDGRMTQFVDRVEYDIRVSVLPTVYGEKIVMRLTQKTVLTRDKKLLGFSDEELAVFDKLLSNPNGIILVTGPTGSGKSTTLYTALSELNTEEVNIITVEDPVEANIDGVNQVQVNVKAELTFAAALRSILRQDPDIIMIGEIRDRETAEIAVTAAITGHLVVSTLHTNSAAATITRLEDMGLEPYRIADSTVGIIAQRLVRKLCTCRKVRVSTEEERVMLGVPMSKKIPVCEPVGCSKCNNTGYKGRMGIYEIMPITSKIRRAITAGKTSEEIEKMALADGMNTLRMSASRLVRKGITSIQEMERVTYSNDNEE